MTCAKASLPDPPRSFRPRLEAERLRRPAHPQQRPLERRVLSHGCVDGSNVPLLLSYNELGTLLDEGAFKPPDALSDLPHPSSTSSATITHRRVQP